MSHFAMIFLAGTTNPKLKPLSAVRWWCEIGEAVSLA
jgi:hypothetical protein